MGRSTRSALKRIGKPEKLKEFFELEISEIYRDGERLKVNTPDRPLQLIPTDLDEGFLIFLYSAQLHLKANGFNRFSSLYQTRDSYPYIKYRRQKLILMDDLEGEEFTYTPHNISKALETMAHFHNAARGLNPMPGSEFKITWGKWPDKCFKEINGLVKQKLSLKHHLQNKFDEMFWEQVDRLIERGLLAWQRFNHDNYRRLLKKEMEAKAFNLHSFKASKLSLVKGEVFIKEMKRIRYELQIYDLAYFLDNILREADIPVGILADCMYDYLKIRPLSLEEWEALKAFILYPKDIYRLIRHFYRKRKVKDSLERFEEFINLLDREEELITHLERLRL